LRRAIDRFWERPDAEVCYQFCQSLEDGIAKARRAVKAGIGRILTVGGDGTVSTVGRELIGTDVALGMIPVGSGNGFARHFGIPLSPARAVQALAGATVRRIDVGAVEDTPFLITCSMAWDASVAKAFSRYPVRGVLPYVLAGMQEFFEYKPQDIRVTQDAETATDFASPLVFTIANLSQYGGGAKIAPHARADDGYLELVVACRQDVPKLVLNIRRLFNGSIDRIPEIMTRRFRELRVVRERASPIQIDGELADAPREVNIRVLPKVLNVLVPEASGGGDGR
jgi:diacylglycerol kinase family enzyme